ncbi:hypothetical protein [Longitalea luteola]|uniref:hypothetical protein n=1 Tax=Longitalea luteola TaxID=2812563 RepID=UPI001A96A531|nr:hypothetical protein [Longitalea luteola]
MNTFANHSSGHSFKQFVFQDRRNRRILSIAAVSIIIQFAFFKYLYPYANFIHGDSFSYLNAADNNLTINTYLIGYSKFLRAVSIFAKPDIVLVSLQYLMIECSALFLIFTILYFYSVRRVMQVVLVSFVIVNPLFLHLANLVSSDGVFLSLSMTWFGLLLWIIFRPSTKVVIWHAVVLFMAFTVRYNAMIYPLIACLAFWMSRLTIQRKLVGVGLVLLLCGWFVGLTMYQYKQLTGHWQYSPFSGWQFANNAMYAYRHVDIVRREPVLAKYRALDNMVRNFYDSTRDLTINPSEKAMASTFYMWSPGMPLMAYRDSLFKNDTAAKELKKWASMGPFYKEYGIYIIKKYPLHFLEYFVWPNTRKYFAPPVEFLQEYNSGNTYVTKQTQKWFGYKSYFVSTRMNTIETWVLNYYPILSGIINVVMVFGLIYYLILKGWKNNEVFNKILGLGASVWLFNAGFTIFASSAALRFQSFPVIVTTVFTLLIINWMIQLINELKNEQTVQSHNTFAPKITT